MKHKSMILISILAVVLVLTAFVAGKASASTGCFTDTTGHWAETFICWMKDNGITSGTAPGIYSPEDYVTRAQMAVFMQKLDDLAVAQANSADATNLTAAKTYTDTSLSTGNIYISAGANGWVNNSTATNSIEYYTSVARLKGLGASTYGFQVVPDLPATLYGHQMYSHSVKLCYDATDPGAFITAVHFRHYSGGASPSILEDIVDLTDRSDSTCRTYTLPSDSPLLGGDHIALFIQITFTAASDFVDIGATTFTLVPSASPGILSPTDTFETIPGMQASQPAAGEAETAP